MDFRDETRNPLAHPITAKQQITANAERMRESVTVCNLPLAPRRPIVGLSIRNVGGASTLTMLDDKSGNVICGNNLSF
jgi:hypothetical protein